MLKKIRVKSQSVRLAKQKEALVLVLADCCCPEPHSVAFVVVVVTCMAPAGKAASGKRQLGCGCGQREVAYSMCELVKRDTFISLRLNRKIIINIIASRRRRRRRRCCLLLCNSPRLCFSAETLPCPKTTTTKRMKMYIKVLT